MIKLRRRTVEATSHPVAAFEPESSSALDMLTVSEQRFVGEERDVGTHRILSLLDLMVDLGTCDRAVIAKHLGALIESGAPIATTLLSQAISDGLLTERDLPEGYANGTPR